MTTYTEVTKPTAPCLKWDDPLNFWDDASLSWDKSGFPEISKPTMKNFLLLQDGGLIALQDDSLINIGGENYSEITKSTSPTYTEITKPS